MLLLIQRFVYPTVFTPGFVAQCSVSFLVYLLSRGPSVFAYCVLVSAKYVSCWFLGILMA